MKLKFYIPISFLLIFSLNLKAQESKLPKHEMRAAWIASVANIDWPSKKGLSVRQQQNEYVDLLDSLVAINMNAVIVQVRPQGDAFYNSSLEPWSEFMTGKQGVAPGDSLYTYDPLTFMVEQSHLRGIEFHAWLNPYRISIYEEVEEKLDTNHIYFQHPEWFVKYGTRYYFNPGVKESEEFVIDVVKEIVANYDIDAIHFDDYFYPYEIKDTPFPDSIQYANYVAQFDSVSNIKVDTIATTINDTVKYELVNSQREFFTVKDWRRGNVNKMV
ncbi:MAG: family 10 glycosylhydrolase, partial [Flavobacteriales bacterium]|nr:family 10 glycosylhydrolase [Flavobacteriales bacterium]